jgi:hypothetical protein
VQNHCRETTSEHEGRWRRLFLEKKVSEGDLISDQLTKDPEGSI